MGIILFGYAATARDAPGSSSASPAQEWQRCQPLEEGSVFAGTVAGTDGRIYTIAGETGESGQFSSQNSAYDPQRNTWIKLAPIPTPRSEPGAAVGPDGRIYVVGGNPTHGRKQASRMNVVEVYNPKTDQWTASKPLPTPRTALCVVAATNASHHVLIYAIGGRNFDMPGNGLSIVEAYDPLKDAWTTMSPMPVNLHAMTATLGPDGRIYVMGGTNSKVTDASAVQIYDPVGDGWKQGSPMPYGQECACSTFIPGQNGEVVVM